MVDDWCNVFKIARCLRYADILEICGYVGDKSNLEVRAPSGRSA